MIKQETGGSYLVTRLHYEQSEEEAFAIRMLSENKIRGLLPLEIRSFNGERNLYYEITGLQSLEAFCRIKPLSGKMLRVLMGDLYGLCRVLPDYILKEDGITLSPDKIFTDTTGFYFCYEIGEAKEGTGEKTDEKLAFAGQLLALLDHEDEEAVLYGYRFYKAAGETKELLCCLEKTLGEKNEEGSDSPPVEIRMQEEKGGEYGKRGIQGSPADENGEEMGKEKKSGQGSGGGRDIGGAILFFALCLIGIALLVIRGMQIQPCVPGLLLSTKEGIAGAAFLLAGLFGVFLSLKNSRTDCKKS